MSGLYVLPHLDSRRTWLWLVVGLLGVSALLVLFAPHATRRRDTIGAGSPIARPQSDRRPMPPPSVARMRALAA